MAVKPFEGGCLCGAIRYSVSLQPSRGVMCHCSMCRRISGAPALAFAIFPKSAFRWLKGEPAWYRSSSGARRGFCRECGSSIAMDEDRLPEEAQICIGTLDEPDRVRLDDHVFASDRVAWFDTKDSAPRYARSSPADPANRED
jgi:hypothetical protein